MPRTDSSPARLPILSEIAFAFARLGAIAFGGPAAHVALMHEEFVRRRRWISESEFLDRLSATNLIPGPNSTEMALHIGLLRGGWRGLLVAGAAFVAPAVAITALLAWVYVRFETLPQIAWLLYGVKPVVLVVVVQAIVDLAPRAVRTRSLAILGACAGAAVWWGANELAVLLAAGLASALGGRLWSPRSVVAAPLAALPTVAAGAGVSLVLPPTLGAIFWVFLKIGAVLFGSGYVLLAFLRADLVERLGWLTDARLIDAVAVGQITPGPVFSTATFVGYLIAGPPGAIVATVGIFLPAFVLVAASGPLVPRLRSSPFAARVLDGVNAASMALMVVVTFELASAAIVDVPSAGFAVVAAVLLLSGRVGPTALLLAGAAGGYAVRTLGGTR